jgi:hypothetical protein
MDGVIALNPTLDLERPAAAWSGGRHKTWRRSRGLITTAALRERHVHAVDNAGRGGVGCAGRDDRSTRERACPGTDDGPVCVPLRGRVLQPPEDILLW